MTLNRFVYKTHKWLAVSVGFFTLLWFGSGVVMMLPQNLLGRPAAGSAGESARPDFRQIAISVPQAIAAAERAAGGNKTATSVDMRFIEGRLYYQISLAKDGTHLIDAVTGTRLDITEEYAQQMAARLIGGRGKLAESGTVRTHTFEYSHGPLPVYRFVFDDASGTIVYIHSSTGEMRARDRKGRIRSFIAGTHTFEFLRPLVTPQGAAVLLILFALVGLVMAVFGSWILLLQFQNWRAQRAGRTETA